MTIFIEHSAWVTTKVTSLISGSVASLLRAISPARKAKNVDATPDEGAQANAERSSMLSDLRLTNHLGLALAITSLAVVTLAFLFAIRFEQQDMSMKLTDLGALLATLLVPASILSG